MDLFVEDHAQEAFLKPLIERVGREEGVHLRVRVRSPQVGAPRALREFQAYQRLLERYEIQPAPDFLVVARDADCLRFAQRREEVKEQTSPAWRDRIVVACPDPHIERWYLADPVAVQQALGSPPARLPRPARRCARQAYKQALVETVRAAGFTPTLGGIEHAEALAQRVDLAQPPERSLRAFVTDLRVILRRVAPPSRGSSYVR